MLQYPNKMKKSKKKKLGYVLFIFGIILVTAKVIDSFVPGRALIPFLTLIGIVLIILGIIFIKQNRDKV